MYCECGCGEKTPLAPRNDPRGRYRKGEPARFIKGHQSRATSPAYEVDEHGCWLWLRSINNRGYGYMRNRRTGEMDLAHRVYWEDAHGPIPKGARLDHRCHNEDESCSGGDTCRHRRCVNPDHTEPRTNRQNCRSGRKAKLTPEQVARIRERLQSGELPRDICHDYPVGAQSIDNIANGVTWNDD